MCDRAYLYKKKKKSLKQKKKSKTRWFAFCHEVFTFFVF